MMTKRKRTHLMAAGILVVGSALAGAVAGGVAQPAGGGGGNFGSRKIGPVSFAGTLDRSSVLLGGDGVARMELVIAADEAATTARRRRPTDLVIVLDRSGSMAGDKIAHARSSVRELMSHLRSEDRFSLVTYASESRIDVPLTHFQGSGRITIDRRVDQVVTGGGTNMSGGLDLGLSLVEAARSVDRVPHLILISDGLANEGDASQHGLTTRAGRAARGEFMLSTIGVGADFNEQMMIAIADAGTGNYYYVRHAEDLRSVFAREFDAARGTVATGLTLRIEPRSGVGVSDVSGYPLERDSGAIVVRPGSLFAGQERRIWVTLDIPNRAIGAYEVGDFSLSYTANGLRHVVAFDEIPEVACVAGENEYYSGVDVGAWSRSVAIEQYNEMQDDVAKKVKAGKRDEALDRLRAFRSQVADQNLVLKSAPVEAKLADADVLEEEVQAAFEGDRNDRAERQNLLGKSKSAAARDSRRVGAKKGGQQ